MTSDSCNLPDRRHLLTEQRNRASEKLDVLDITQTLRLINDEDAHVPNVVRGAIPSIAALTEGVIAALKAGGRLIYVGAGTSGRLGVLDASECPPTFHCDPGQVVGFIAGGDAALRSSVEGAEDDPEGAAEQLDRLNVDADDVVVGIAAGGTTPYVLGALGMAKERRATTALICCVELDAALAHWARDLPAREPGMEVIDHVIKLPVGPEVVTGSTRMKAGTATKLVLNMITTTAMVQIGKTWGNLMVDLRATSAKLRDRAARIISRQCDVSRNDALTLLDRAEGSVKVALVMAKRHVDIPEARRKLIECEQRLRPIIGAPG